MLAGNNDARDAFVRAMTPIVRHRVARVLHHRARRIGNEPQRQDLIDLVHDVFLALLDRDARVLRSWDPKKGLSLANFVGLVAEREAGSILRSGRRSAWAEEPSDDIVERASHDASSEQRVEARQELELLLHHLQSHLSPRGHELFRALYVEHLPMDELCERHQISRNAAYTFKSRLKKLVDNWRVEEESRQVDASSTPARGVVPMWRSLS